VANSLLQSAVVLMLLVAWPAPGWGQESLQAAQTLYASASYDEALAVLDRLQHQPLTASEVRVVHQQRALCLLALGRAQDADQAIAMAVQADPTYRPDDGSASPRVRTAFRDVRGRLLPGIVQAEYVEARRLYDTSSWAQAAAAFQRVASLAADRDLSETQVAALTDLRMLADGFAKLAEAAATPPPPPPAPEPAAPSPPPPPPVDYDRVFDGSQAGVVPPVTVRQDLPRWSSGVSPLPRVTGLLEIVIAKSGVVERASLTQPISNAFDRQVLDATKNWRYQPAQVNGQPVRFRKTIKITFQ
jgi:TonB family protein